nr:hypothetical protein [Tanacetum cinerariifolium]
MANVPLNDPNVDAFAIVPTPVNPDHAPAQPVGHGNGFAPHRIGDNIPNNQNGWIEEDPKEEEDPEEDPKEDDDDDMEIDDEAEPIPPIALFSQNFHFSKSSSTTDLLTRNSKIVLTGPMCPNLGMAWKRLEKMEKLMSKRIDTEGRVKKKFKEQDRHFVGLEEDPEEDPEEDSEEDPEENPGEDPEEDPEEEPEDDDDDMEMDDEAEVIDPYMDDGSNNPPPPNSEDEETPPTSPVIPDTDGQPIPPIASFGQNFHFGESSSTANLLTGNSKIVSIGPMCPNLGMAWKR